MFRFVGEFDSNPQLTVEIKGSKGTSGYAEKHFRVLNGGLPGTYLKIYRGEDTKRKSMHAKLF